MTKTTAMDRAEISLIRMIQIMMAIMTRKMEMMIMIWAIGHLKGTS